MKLRTKLILGLPFLLALAGVTSCGVPVCVAGLGDCSAYFDKQENLPTPTVTPTPNPSGALIVSGLSVISLTSPITTYTTSGGSGVYTYTVNPSACGQFSFTVAGSFTAATVANCIITVTDTSVPTRNGTFNLSITN